MDEGKPPEGQLNISYNRTDTGSYIYIQDDGIGLDLKQIAVKSAKTAKQADIDAMINTIFEPGLSTKTTATVVSGRGMGMEAVKSYANQFQGDVHIEPIGPVLDNNRIQFRLAIFIPQKHHYHKSS